MKNKTGLAQASSIAALICAVCGFVCFSSWDAEQKQNDKNDPGQVSSIDDMDVPARMPAPMPKPPAYRAYYSKLHMTEGQRRAVNFQFSRDYGRGCVNDNLLYD
ncbi:MAG TPA: hypothetical protein V6C81_26495 [Planktothrix sp.]